MCKFRPQGSQSVVLGDLSRMISLVVGPYFGMPPLEEKEKRRCEKEKRGQKKNKRRQEKGKRGQGNRKWHVGEQKKRD